MKKILILFICLLTARLCFADAISNPPLNVEEQDGTPSTFPYKLKVTNGTLTDNGDGTSSLTTGGGGGTPGGADTQVQFNDNGSFGGSGQFTFDKTTNVVTASIVSISNTVTSSVVSLEGGTFDTYFTAGAPTASAYYELPSADGTNGQFLSTNGSGRLSWATSSGAGDITDVGDCANGACFTGSSGNTLTFKGGTSGTIGLKPTAIAGVNTITLPAETGTACTTASVCSGYQPSGTYVTNVTGTSPIASSGGTTPAISIANAAADGSTKGAASFTANDFDASLGNISIDYTNGQAASAGAKGFLTSGDWTTFNNKQSALVNSAGLAAALSDETGTGNAVFSASPTFTGTIQAASINASDTVTGSVVDIQYIDNSTGSIVTIRNKLTAIALRNTPETTQTLTDAANIDWNMNSGGFATVTLGGSRIFNAPTNLKDGGSYILFVKQDGVGNRTLSWNGVFKWSGGAPTLSTAGNAVDIITFVSDGTNLYGSFLGNFL